MPSFAVVVLKIIIKWAKSKFGGLKNFIFSHILVLIHFKKDEHGSNEKTR